MLVFSSHDAWWVKTLTTTHCNSIYVIIEQPVTLAAQLVLFVGLLMFEQLSPGSKKTDLLLLAVSSSLWLHGDNVILFKTKNV